MFVPGGHNPLEPAQFGIPVIIGPHYENFRGIVERLRIADAIVVAEPSALPRVIRGLLGNESAAKAMGMRAHKVFKAEAGATARAVSALLAVLEERV